MAEVDASIPLNASGPKPINPLETLGSVAGIAGQINQNRLFNQTIQSKQALSRIYQEAIDPNTGRIDTGRLQKMMAEDPSISLGVPEAAAGAQGLRSGQLDIDTKQFDLAKKHLDQSAQRFSALLAKPPGQLTQKDFIQLGGTMIAEGTATPEEVANELANLPPDEAGLRAVATQFLLRSMDASQRLNALSPAPTAVNTGGATQLVRAPAIGQPSIAGTLPNTLGPEAQNQRVATFQNNQPGSVPLASVAVPGTVPGAATGGGAPGVPSAAGGAPSGFLPSGAPLGASAAADVTAHGNADQGLNLQKAADQVPTMKATLSNMDSLLDKFTSGPGADWSKAGQSGFNTFLQAVGGGVGYRPEAVASQEDFNKQAGMIAQQQFQMLGGTGTDAKLDSAFSTSPNSALSHMGNKEIIGLLKGNADAIAAKNRAWQAYLKDGQHGPQDYGEFSTSFNQTYDPRVFQFQYIKPDKRTEIFKAMSPSDRASFRQAMRIAIGQGWVNSDAFK